MSIYDFYFSFPGLTNDTITLLQQRHPHVMDVFLSSFSIRAEGMCGGKFNGPNCKRFLYYLPQLELYLGEGVGQEIISYLKTLKELHHLMVAKTLNPDFKIVIDRWRKAFDILHHLYNFSMTEKAHILYHHAETFFLETGNTLHMASAEGIEASHSKFKTVGQISLFIIREYNV